MDLTRNDPRDLVHMALAVVRARGDLTWALDLAAKAKASSRVRDILAKSAVTAGDIASPSWGSTLDDYRSATAAFLSALRTSSVFARVAADAASLKVPVDRRGRYTAIDAVADTAGNGAAKAVSTLSLGVGDGESKLAAAIVVLTEEVFKFGDSAEQIMRRSLSNAVSRALDAPFLTYLLNQSASPVTASASPLATIQSAISRLTLHEGSRLMLVTTPAIVGKLAFYPESTNSNARAFPELNANGGAIGDLIVMASDAIPAASTANSPDEGIGVLFDISQMIVGNDPIQIAMSDQASVELDDAPAGTADSVMTSLWQRDLAALRAESKITYFARPGATVEINGIDW